MKKRIIAPALVLLMVLAAVSVVARVGDNFDAVFAAAAFTDFSSNEAVDFLVEQGVINGYEDGTFRPNNEITRAEFTAMLCRAMKEENEAKSLAGRSEFSDVKSSNWAAGYIRWAKNNGIINGMGDGTFNPQGNVTYEQTIKMIVLAMGYEESLAEDKGGYPKGYMEIGQSAGLYIDVPITWEVPGGVSADKNTRRIVAHTMYNAFCNTSFAAKCREIIAGNIEDGMTELEKEKAIHDYLVLNTAYDYENYLKNTIPQASYTSKGVIMKGVGVCSGYAAATELLMNMAGIECMVISGEANGIGGRGGHAWNIVKINGEYYQLDTTWDDPVPNRAGYVRYNYFNISDDTISKDHIWEKNNRPSCTVDMDPTLYGEKKDDIDWDDEIIPILDENFLDELLESDTDIIVPNCIGMWYEDAYNAVRALGGMFSNKYEYSNTVQTGYVISQSPAPGTSAAKYATIDIIISQGPNYYDPNRDDYVRPGEETKQEQEQQDEKFDASYIQLQMNSTKVSPGHSETIRVFVNPEDSVIAWSSSDESIATVSKDGHLSVIGVGTVTITATANGKIATLTVISEQASEQDSEQNPEQDPEQNSEQDTEQTSEQNSEQDPEQTSEQDPEQTSEQNPEQNPEQTSEQDSEQNPEQTSEQNPEQASEQGV
jgi:hypothetical protein